MNSKESQTTGVVTVTKTNAADPSTSLTIADLEKAVGEINYTPIEWINGGGAPWGRRQRNHTLQYRSIRRTKVMKIISLYEYVNEDNSVEITPNPHILIIYGYPTTGKVLTAATSYQSALEISCGLVEAEEDGTDPIFNSDKKLEDVAKIMQKTFLDGM